MMTVPQAAIRFKLVPYAFATSVIKDILSDTIKILRIPFVIHSCKTQESKKTLWGGDRAPFKSTFMDEAKTKAPLDCGSLSIEDFETLRITGFDTIEVQKHLAQDDMADIGIYHEFMEAQGQ